MRPPKNVVKNLISVFKKHGHNLPVLPLLLSLLAVLPVVVVSSAIFTPTLDIWLHLGRTLLPEITRNTLLLLAGVGTGTLLLGVGLAWIVTAYSFPGRRVLEWALMLPMAVPAYVKAFVFMAIFDFAGPVQSFLRQHVSATAWFPEIRSGTGAIVVMTLVLYPYVYLLAKAGFREQSGGLVEAARVMGYGPAAVFVKVILPLARPSIAAGVTLAMMEALADFATVRFLNFPTLSDGVIRVWHGLMDLRAASELAGLLAMAAFVLLLLEHRLRGRTRYFQTGGRSPGITPVKLRGWRSFLAAATCLLVVAAAFVLPVAQLISWSVKELLHQPAGALAVYLRLAGNSIVLSVLAALFATIAAALLASGIRTSGSKAAFILARLATSGYAMPGAVIAVGIILPLSAFDHALNNVLYTWRGINVGLLITGSVVGLIYAYIVRFIAVSYSSVNSSIEKITPNVTAAARVLGASPWRLFRHIHFPLAAPGMLAGGVLIFVDVMKELPITLMLRPFSYDTLAVWVWQMAAESAWGGASLPALFIVLTGLIPVILIMRASSRKF